LVVFEVPFRKAKRLGVPGNGSSVWSVNLGLKFLVPRNFPVTRFLGVKLRVSFLRGTRRKVFFPPGFSEGRFFPPPPFPGRFLNGSEVYPGVPGVNFTGPGGENPRKKPRKLLPGLTPPGGPPFFFWGFKPRGFTPFLKTPKRGGESFTPP